MGELGVGGMSTVVRALDKDLRRYVAIKVLSPELSANETEVKRFNAEARITGQLEHPYIVPVYEFGSDHHNGPFLCMKLVHGKTLEKMLEEAGISRLESDRLADLLQIFVKVCDAVAFAHSRGIIHRDLKPSNVMIGEFGQVYVLDWGVARWDPPGDSALGQIDLRKYIASHANLDPPGFVVGTPCYMAPEQLWGQHDEIGPATDIFSLGAILYQILTGQPPRLPESVRSALVGKLVLEVVPPDEVVKGAAVPAELSRIALKAMSHRAGDRHPCVDDLKADVDRFLRGAWHLPRAHFGAGTLIIRAGDPGDAAYIIASGRCGAFRVEDGAEITLREMGPGDVFGETAVFSNKPRTASVKALTDAVLLTVTSQTLSSALGLNSWMGAFVKALAERFREVDDKLRVLEQDRRRSIPPSK